MLKTPTSFPVLNLPVHLLEDYTTWLKERMTQNLGTHVVTLNAEMAMLAEQDSSVAEIIRSAELVIPDGAGVILYLKLRGQEQSRCPGIELAESLIAEIGQEGDRYPIVFFGGQPGVTEQAALTWRTRIPQISILSNHGYLNETDLEQWKQTIKEKQPKLILVGLGVPRQEFWISSYRSLCPNAVWIGVGGSFDIWSGSKTRAPRWLRDNNLEWLYRLYQEPWRWKRMLVLPQFLMRSLLFS